jgi:hypothetical protein
VEVTGSLFEWTGYLREPVRGYDSVGIDGLVDGWVVDAKLAERPAEESRHLHGRVGLPKGDEELQDVVRSYESYRRRMREPDEPEAVDVHIERSREPPPTPREKRAWSEQFEIKVVGQMERQLQFAKENGLNGVRWVVSAPDVADVLRREFAQRFPGQNWKVVDF